MAEHECKGSKLEEVFFFESNIVLVEGPYVAKEFLENVKFCPWCGEVLK